MKYHYLFLLILFSLNGFTTMGQCPRKTVIDNYNNKYLPSAITNAELQWTGEINNCESGTLSDGVLAKHLQRINYYRELIGGLAPITLNDEKNQQALAAVLMFEAQNTPAPPIQNPLEISHCSGQNGAPCDTYSCSTFEGINAAQRGNISFSTTGWDFTDPIDLYMKDDDAFNQLVAHRRWILNSKATDMGIATSPRFNTMYVVDGFFNPSIYDEFIAYPPNGYIPQTLVPLRWSFGIPEADFTNASVIMTDPNGTTIPVTISSRNALNYADNTIAWDPSSLITDSNQDLTYTITISNIGNAPQSSYTYESTIVPISYPPLCPTTLVWNEANCACAEAAPVCPTEPIVITTSPQNCTQQPKGFIINVTGANYTYDFGDGSRVENTPDTAPLHVYNEPGNYTFTAIVEYPNGCIDSASLEVPMITSTADFTYTIDGKTIRLEADTTNAANITNYRWLLGDGTVVSGLSTSIEHTYDRDGQFVVVLQTDGTCISFSSSELITIEKDCSSLSMALSTDNEGCSKSVFLEVQGESGNYDYSYPSSLILSNGNLIVQEYGLQVISVTDNVTGCQVTDSIYVDSIFENISYSIDSNFIQFTISEQLITTGWTTDMPGVYDEFAQRIPTPPNGTYEICFPNTFCTDTGNIITECVSNIMVGSGTPPIDTMPIDPVLMEENTLEKCTDGIDNNDNGVLDANEPSCVCILAPTLQANFSYTTTADSIYFTDNSTGQITDKQWTFNMPDMIMNDRAALPPTGSYEVCLQVQDDCEQSDSLCQTITISCTDTPLEIFPLPNNTTCIRMPISVVANSDPVIRFKWVNGEGQVFEIANPTPFDIPHDIIHHTEGGLYTISLEVEYFNGCIESTTYDYEALSNEATIQVEELEDGLTYKFTALPKNEAIITNFNWNIDDFPFGSQSGKEITHTFSGTNEYSIRLETSANSCLPFLTNLRLSVVETQPETDPLLCVDGLDNDKDGLIDCEDSDCSCMDCPTDLTLTTQTEVDNFVNNFSGCTEVTGNLTIQSDGGTIRNLEGLSVLTKVSGNLSILNNHDLNFLNGLGNISNIGGSLIIDNNANLTSTEVLRLNSIGGDISIGNNPILRGQLIGRSSPHPTYIGGGLKLSGPTQLAGLGNLLDITSLGGDLEIANQLAMTSLEGLNNLKHISGNIEIVNNPILENLQTLINLTSIDGYIVLHNNDQLTSLSGLDNIDPNTVLDIAITGSLQLSFCAINPVCVFLEDIDFPLIANNATGCEGRAAILSVCNSNIAPPLFDDYTWLSGLVNPNNCNGEKITEYATSSGQIFLNVETTTGTILYVADGRTWCTSGTNYDCTSFYTPQTFLRTWECGDVAPSDEDMDGVLSDSDPDDTNPCVPNNQAATCGNPPAAPDFLSNYPWLSDLVDFDNCTNEVITIYRTSPHEYLYIQTTPNTAGKLYNAAGQFYCNSSSNYDCLAAYNLTEIVDTWQCGDQPAATDMDEDGILSDIDPDDTNPCVPDSTTTACVDDTGNTGTGGGNTGNPPTFQSDYPWLSDLVDFDNCSAEKITVYRSSGYIYLLVESPQSSILYSASGQTYCTNSPSYDCQAFYTIDEEIAVWNCGDEGPTPIDSDNDGSLSDVDPDDNDPCIPDNTVVNCDTIMQTIGSAPPDFLENYLWLNDLVNFETCTTDKITVYKSGGYTYLFIETPQQSILYNANGLRYCTNSATYDCQAFYNVDEVISIWACGSSEPIVVPVDGDGDGITDDVDPDDMDACNPDPTTALCLLDSGTLPPFFEQYPWLADVISPFDCGTAKVTVYKSSGYNYLFVEDGGFPILYNTTGLRYCSNSSNYNCQEFYTVDEIVEIWECENSLQETPALGRINFNGSSVSIPTFQVFPNPTTGRATLQIAKNLSVLSVEVSNLQGQLIQTLIGNQTAYSVDLENHESGIYIIQVIMDGGVYSQKLVLE